MIGAKCRTFGCCLCSAGVACMIHGEDARWRDEMIAESCCNCCQGADESTWRKLTAEECEVAYARVAREARRIAAMFPPGAMERIMEVAE